MRQLYFPPCFLSPIQNSRRILWNPPCCFGKSPFGKVRRAHDVLVGDCSPGGMFLKRLSVLLKKFPVRIFDFPRRMDRQIREAGERAGEEGFSTATASRNHPTTVNLLLGSRSILKEERKCRSCVRKIRAKPAPGCADMKKG